MTFEQYIERYASDNAYSPESTDTLKAAGRVEEILAEGKEK